jgi:hypothetical protein
MIALVDQPAHDFRLFETLAQIRQCKPARHDEPIRRT